jgi:hypothetical protein
MAKSKGANMIGGALPDPNLVGVAWAFAKMVDCQPKFTPLDRPAEFGIFPLLQD